MRALLQVHRNVLHDRHVQATSRAVPSGRFSRQRDAKPAIRDRLMAYIVTRGAGLQASLADQLLHPSEQRLARALLVLAGCDPCRPCACALPPVSQETIAEVVGTTRPRVNVFMGKFKKLGFIEEGDGRLLVKPSLMSLLYDAE